MLQRSSSAKKSNRSQEFSTKETSSVAAKLEDKFKFDEIQISELRHEPLSAVGFRLSQLKAFNDLFGETESDLSDINKVFNISEEQCSFVPKTENRLAYLFNNISLN